MAQVEDIHFLLLFRNLVDHTIDLGFGAIEQAPEVFVLGCHRTAVSIVSKAADGVLKPPIPGES